MQASWRVDVLADLLSRANARGAVFATTTVHGEEWTLRFDEAMRFGVHVVLDGTLSVDHADGSTVQAHAGEVVAVRTQDPDGRAQLHDLSGRARARHPQRLGDFRAEAGVQRSERQFVGGGAGRPTSFLCGAYRFDGDLCSTLLDAMPSLFVVPALPGTTLRAAVDLLATEIAHDRPGQQTLLDRLLDVVLICVLREYLDRSERRPAWYAALSDPAVAQALSAIHAAPAATHTVASLAAAVQLSRAAFAQRFTAVMGTPPLGYVTAWRLTLAREQLRETNRPLGAIARSVGYSSGYAFAAAFKRAIGVAPGQWRSTEARVTDRGSRTR